jgi:uncharacterized membrane protein
MVAESRDGSASPPWRLPADLAVAVLWLLLADLVTLAPVVRETPLRTVVALPVLLLVPGWVVVAAVFPAAGGPGDARRSGIDGLERVALAVAVSIPVLTGIGLALALAPIQLGLATVLPALNLVVLLGVALAVRRRRALPESQRFHVPVRRWFRDRRAAMRSAERTRRETLLTALLGISVLVALAGVTYAVAAPYQGETYTEFYLLTENGTQGLVAADYPYNGTVGEPTAITVGIENHEGERTNYTVTAQLQRLGNQTSTVVELDRFDVDIDHNETWHGSRTFEPTVSGDDIRLVYLLYRGSPPADQSIDTAYRAVRIPLNVTE